MAFWQLQSEGAEADKLCQAAREAEAAWRKVLADPPAAIAPHHKYPATNAKYWGRRVVHWCGGDATT